MKPPPLGQHFLADAQVLERLVGLIDPQPDDAFVEVGPGQGQLTRPLLEAGAQVIAIERDGRLAAQLPARLGALAARCEVVVGDAARRLPQPVDGPWRLVGNLPYAISSPLLAAVAKAGDRLRDCHFMLQREFAERLCASPGSRSYGRLTVGVQVSYEAQLLMDVAPSSFDPPPKVDSAVVRITPRARPRAVADAGMFERITRLAFSQRRKKLGNALAPLALPLDDRLSSLRAEDLSVDDYIDLANSASGSATQ